MENIEKNCSDCTQANGCKSTYEQLGRQGGPSVVWKVVVAFMLPIAVFIASLAIFGEIFEGAFDGEKQRIGLTFISSIVTTFIGIIVTRAVNLYFGKSEGANTMSQKSCVFEGDERSKPEAK
jgi:hypothetical protein